MTENEKTQKIENWIKDTEEKFGLRRRYFSDILKMQRMQKVLYL